jgi:hypothetical protein
MIEKFEKFCIEINRIDINEIVKIQMSGHSIFYTN